MKQRNLAFLLMLFMIAACTRQAADTTGMSEEDRKMERVRIAFQAKYPNAQIRQYMWLSTEPNEYQVKAVESALTRTVVIRSDGSILDDKAFKQITRNEMPKPVTASIEDRFPGKKVFNPKRLLHNGNLEYYAVVDMNESTSGSNGREGYKHLTEVYAYPGGAIRNTVSHWKGEPWATKLLKE